MSSDPAPSPPASTPRSDPVSTVSDLDGQNGQKAPSFWRKWRPCLLQHLVLGAIACALYFYFMGTKEGLPDGHRVNRSWADASMVFLFASLIVGPLARLWSPFKCMVPWRRDLGLWFAITSGIHVYLLAKGRDWNVLRFFFDEEGAFTRQAAHSGNWVGLVAVALILLLVVTSNRYSERLLGGVSWKFLQQSAYSVFLLGVLHTFIFVYQVDSRKSEAFRWVFWLGIALTCGLQLWGFVRATRLRRARRFGD